MENRIDRSRAAVRITREHLPGVAELERLCFSEPWSETALELLTGDGAVGYAVVADDGTVLAYGGMLYAPGEGQITNIAVRPEARRHGYGECVTRALIRAAEERGAEQVSLEVRVSNEAAIALYRKSGFCVAGVRKRFYKNPPEDGYVMLKRLTGTDAK